MTIKVQGETYDSPEEVITAIGELSAALEDLPETAPGRADLETHIERLKTAVAPTLENATIPSGDPADDPEGGDPLAVAVEPPPDTTDVEETESPPDDDIPDGYIGCPVCQASGLLIADAPVSLDHEQCPKCKGYGRVLTGSHVDGHIMADCKECLGNGYINARSNYVPQDSARTVASAPGWPGSTWNAEEERWEPPAGEPPWTGAVWDALKGTYQ